MDTETKVVYEFGPFRMDAEQQVLLRDDQPIAITPKAFDTLLLLVQRNREVVSKKELMETVWPDSFVEEANLSQTVFMLRKALGDTQEERRYIVTLPGRGYRFAAPVRAVTGKSDTLVAQMRSRTQIVIEQTAPEPAEIQPALPPPARSKRAWLIPSAILAVLAIAALTTFLLLRRPTAIPAGARDSVLVAEFANLTSDPVFDNTLRQGLQVQLQQSPTLTLVSEDRIQQTLRLMGQPADARLTPQLAREVCIRTSTAAMLEASIESVGLQYVLNLTATNCRTGEVIDREQIQVSRKEDVLAAIGHITSQFRQRVGESQATLEKHDVPLAEATTASLDALKAYSLGLKVIATQGEEASIPFFKQAIDIDPNFAMAYAYLALMYGSTGSSGLATEYARKAYELGAHISDNERFFISAYYFGRATGNQEKARQVCEEWAQMYPREPLPHAFLSGFIYPVLANHDGAHEEGRKLIELKPDAAFSYVLYGENAVHIGRLDSTRDALSRAKERGLSDDPRIIVLRFDLASSQGDATGMQQAVAAAQGKPDAMDLLADRQAFALAQAGQLQRARVFSRQAVDLAQQQGDRERAAEFAVRAALWDAFFGDVTEAKRAAAEALNLAKNRETEYGAAVALALAGDSRQAESLAADLESKYPDDTSVRFNYVPVIRALLALSRNQPDKALALLETSTPYELATPRSASTGYYGSLYPILVRGEAYLAAHKGPEATREFQKLVDHHSIMMGDATSALAGYGLARSYALTGDSANARAQYQQFLTLWKDADPDLPVLKKAKAEFAKLQ